MLTVATFNVNSIRSRMPVIEPWLKDNPVDVVALQELKGDENVFPRKAFEEMGYEVCVNGQKSYNGVAIASRIPMEEKIIPELDFCKKGDARVVLAKISGIWMLNTYVPQGQSVDSDKFQYKLNFLEGIGRYLREEGFLEDRALWMGDINVALEDRDVYNPDELRGKVTFHPDEQKAFTEASEGMIDLFRKHKENSGLYTFWDYRIPNGFKRNLGWRIDYILATPEVADHSVDAWVEKDLRGREKPSDHAPLVVQFNL